jgi:hypothetical protein
MLREIPLVRPVRVAEVHLAVPVALAHERMNTARREIRDLPAYHPPIAGGSWIVRTLLAAAKTHAKTA